MEYDKAGGLIEPERVPSGQGPSQVTPSPFSPSQVYLIPLHLFDSLYVNYFYQYLVTMFMIFFICNFDSF